MAKTCCFPGCGASATHRCDNCGGHVCVDHVRDDGRYLICLTCEPEPVPIPLGAGCRVRVLKGGASVYGDPDTRAEKLMFLNPGSEVEAVEEVGGFYHVLAGECEGYIPRLSAELSGERGETGLWWSRVGATLIDDLVSYAVYFVVALLGFLSARNSTSQAGTAMWLASAASLGYWWLTHGPGYSAGKLLLGLRIVDESGLTPNFWTTLVRSGVSIVSGLPLGLGYLWALWDNSGQTWHDKVAGTYVVRKGQVPAEDAPAATEVSDDVPLLAVLAVSRAPKEIVPPNACAEAAHVVTKVPAESIAAPESAGASPQGAVPAHLPAVETAASREEQALVPGTAGHTLARTLNLLKPRVPRVREHAVRWVIALTIGGIVLVTATATIVLRASGEGEAASSFIFGSRSDPTPTAEPQPAFARQEVLELTTRATSSRPFPDGAEWVRCFEATFRPANRMWMVNCEYTVDSVVATGTPCPYHRVLGGLLGDCTTTITTVVAKQTWLFDDQTGEVR